MILWIGFLLIVVACLALDLGLFAKRHAHGEQMTLAEAGRWSVVWISVGLAFAGVVYVIYEYDLAGFELETTSGPKMHGGAEAAGLYLTAYVLEKSLSIDNLFVMAVIFRSFNVKPLQQHRVLMWGIIGAIVMRGVMIGGGLYLIQRFTFLFYILGAYLAYSGVKLALEKEDEEKSPMDSWLARTLNRVLPITQIDDSDRFTVVINGQRHFTQLFLCLLMIEATDVVFAVDSVPAVLAITVDPFVCYTSNIFAILGLRSLYFVLAEMMVRFKYLKHALSFILVFIGAKLFFHHTIQEHVPQNVQIWVSLSVIILSMTLGIVLSLRSARGDGDPPVPPAGSVPA